MPKVSFCHSEYLIPMYLKSVTEARLGGGEQGDWGQARFLPGEAISMRRT